MKANFANIAPRMAAIAVAAMADTGKPTHTRKKNNFSRVGGYPCSENRQRGVIVTDSEILDVIKATLYLSDSQIDAKALMSDVKRQVTLNWVKDESDADSSFVRCPCCGNGNGACGCFWLGGLYGAL
jgi:hypothetical protein